MKSKQVDYLNIGLMVVSFFLAILMPFKLFLFSYAILGPLHYLTEIGWLKKQQYFTKKKSDYVWLVVLCLLVTVGALTIETGNWKSTTGVYQWLRTTPFIKDIINLLIQWQANFIFVAFIAALAFTIFNKTIYKLALIVVGALFAYQMTNIGDQNILLIFGVFIPTILHVSLFTGAFILYGALKSKNFSAYLSFLIFIICIIAFFLVGMDAGSYQVGQYVKDTFASTKFDRLTIAIGELFVDQKTIVPFSYNNDLLLRIQAFIAFSYTYHYLNWFSKTSIIKWHEVPRAWIVASFSIWIASIALYFYNYRIGLMALFFLSLLHVFLEFPLNHRTFMFIGSEFWNKISGKSVNIKTS